MATCWFLFPHPDDEFAVTALLAEASGRGERVHCFYLTDGSFGGQAMAPRRRESLRVLARLGVPAAQVHFTGAGHGFRDGRLCESLDAALAALVQAAATAGPPDRLYCPAWEGGHQDHDALHLVGLALARRFPAARARQFPLYTGAGLPGPCFRVLRALAANGPVERRPASTAERLAQLRAGLGYPSQWRTWLGLFPFLAWHVLSDGAFRLQPLDAARVRESPHAGAPLYARRGFMSEAAFRAAAEPFIRARIGAG
jgi:LmbE family N-acetylglucosaminyl deacetylase